MQINVSKLKKEKEWILILSHIEEFQDSSASPSVRLLNKGEIDGRGMWHVWGEATCSYIQRFGGVT
jgi:hypothetical protein